jgi:hypothetical protein
MGASTKTRFALVEPYSVEAFIKNCRASGLRMGRLREVVVRAILQLSVPFDFDALWAATKVIDHVDSEYVSNLLGGCVCRWKNCASAGIVYENVISVPPGRPVPRFSV